MITRIIKRLGGPRPPKFNPKVRWWSDPEWLARYERHLAADGLGGRSHPHRILDRRFTLASFAKAARGLKGDTAECGVLRGTSSALICETLRDTYGSEHRHWAFDSFEGLPKTGATDAQWKKGDLSVTEATARAALADFPYVSLIKGWIPESLAVVAERKFRLVHIDVDIETSTRDCLTFFYPRAVPGAVFVIDDYGFHSCPGARKSVDHFLSNKPEALIELTTGQGVFFRSGN
ncbi:MAG: hypothetical protein FJW40_18520 [Acidobacteria bacterium]|nr:hypothetical protein [Acidobacteriota bacterium]